MHLSIFTTDDVMWYSVSFEFDIVAQYRWIYSGQGSSWAWAHIQRKDAHLVASSRVYLRSFLAWGLCVSSLCHGVIRPYTGYAVCGLKSPLQNQQVQYNVVLEMEFEWTTFAIRYHVRTQWARSFQPSHERLALRPLRHGKLFGFCTTLVTILDL